MSRTLVTFYSFKGGVGRTQALANVAVQLANDGRDVVLLDMDLESPGLHTYFTMPPSSGSRHLSDRDLAEATGLIDILTRFVEVGGDDPPEVLPHLIEIHHPRFVPSGRGRLRMLPAGRLDAGYLERVATFSWHDFYRRHDGYAFMEFVRYTLLDQSGADIVLVDSRTGQTDVGNVCTAQLPEILVIPFALHRQGIVGTRDVVARVTRHRDEQGVDARLRKVVLVPSRVEEDGNDEQLKEYLSRARRVLGKLGDGVELRDKIGSRIPYHAAVAYGEPVVVGGEPTHLSQAYEALARRITVVSGWIGQPADDKSDIGDRPSTPFPPTLLTRLLGEVNETVQAMEEKAAQAPAEAPLSELPKRTETLLRLDSTLRRRRSHLLDMCAAIAPDPPTPWSGEPITVVGWREEAIRLEVAVVNALERWRAHRREQARQRLVMAADGNRSIANREFDALDVLITADESPDALDAWLSAREAEFDRLRVGVLLERGELDEGTLARWYPGLDERRSWLWEQLAAIHQAKHASTDPERTGAGDSQHGRLNNLLSLLAPLVESPDAQLWGAYETLCLAFQGEISPEEKSAFEGIALEWWLAHWRSAISARSFDRPTAVAPRRQLDRFAAELPELIEPIVTLLVNLLHEEALSPEETDALLDRGGEDPALRRAIHRLGRDRARRPLLASHLRRVGCTNDLDGVEVIAEALASDGQAAEALHLLGVVARQVPRIADRLPALRVGLYFTIAQLETIGSSSGTPLEDSDFRERAVQDPIGRVLLLAVAGQVVPLRPRDSGIDTPIRNLLLHAERPLAPLEPAEVEWLQWLERHPFWDLTSAPALRSAEADARSALYPTFYKGWVGSQFLAEKFKPFWDAWIKRLMDSPRPPEGVESQLDGLDAENWIHATVAELRSQGRRLKDPDGPARRNLRTSFDTARGAVIELARRLPDGFTGRALLEADDRRQKFAASIRRHLTEAHRDGADLLAERLDRCLEAQ